MTISLAINLPYGWAKRRSVKWFSSWRHGQITKHKAWEWQTDYFGWNSLFNLDLDLIPTGHDHAGIGVSLTILGFMVDAKIYDTRHWDDENGTWEKYDEESITARLSRDEQRRQDELENARNLLKFDNNLQNKLELTEYLKTPQGQALLDSKVKDKLEEQRQSKDAKRARGEEYRRQNQASASGTQEV